MDATALLAALFFCLPCSPLDQQAGESITTPAAQSIFIEVYLAEPITGENVQVPTSTTPAIVDGPALDRSGEIAEPIGNDDELDQIEPMFVEDNNAAQDDEPVPVEAAPVDAVPPAAAQDAAISAGDSKFAPATEAIEESTNNEIVNDLSAEIAEPIEYDPALLDAPLPIVVENVNDMPEPHPESVDMPVSDPETTTTVFASPQIVEPDSLPATETVTVPTDSVVEETIGSPLTDFDEPVRE